ncbi:MAG: FHA domain-containing protein [Anaerolineae bacterium]|nr:FHA domain-containing protein [Anaerolineae bacterium]
MSSIPVIKLIIENGSTAGQVLTIGNQPKTIGRGSSNNVIIQDSSLSRVHARVKAGPQGLVVEDLGSTNGTYINNSQISGSAVGRSGDTIRLGTTITARIQVEGDGDEQETMMPGTVLADNPAAPVASDHTVIANQTVMAGGGPVETNATYVHASPPFHTHNQPQSYVAAWLWVVVAVLIAALIVGGALGYLYYTNVLQAAPPPVVAQLPPPPTDTATPEPEPTATSTATPESLSVPGIAMMKVPQQPLPPEGTEIDPFCQTQIEISADEAVYIRWQHPLAEPDDETDYLTEWINTAHYDVTLNGRPIDTLNYYQDENFILNLWHQLGLLEPGSHFLRIQWYTSRQISNGLDIAPPDGQVDTFGPGPAGEGSCEIVVAEPLAAATFTPIPSPTAMPSPSPTTKSQVSLPSAPLGIFQDFESVSNWKRGDQPYGEFTRSSEQVHSGSYAGQLNYNFPSSDNDYVVFLQNRRLDGRPNAISAWVYGDGSEHFLNVWVKDANGQTWGMNFGQVEHTGWQEMTAFLDPAQPWPSGHIGGPNNGAIDYPITFHAIVLDDGSDDYSGQGVIYIDDLNSQEGVTLPTPTPMVIVQQGGGAASGGQPGSGPAASGGYILVVGGQHKYTEPWGAPWDGDACRAHRENNWNDKARMRAFHLQLLLTNNTNITVPHAWLPDYVTATGKTGRFCFFGYGDRSTAVAPGATGDVTFFTVVDQGDYVQQVILTVNGQTIQLCLGPDGMGGPC